MHSKIKKGKSFSFSSNALKKKDLVVLVAELVGTRKRPTDDEEIFSHDRLSDLQAPERPHARNSIGATQNSTQNYPIPSPDA